MRTRSGGAARGCVLIALLMSINCGDDSGDDGGGTSAGRGSGAGSPALPSAGSSGSGARTPLPADTAGKPCASNGDCGPGTCAMQVQGLDGQPIMAPGGYCMGACTADADCGAGGVCVGAGGLGGMMSSAMGQCYDGCSTDADCRMGYVCGPLTSTCRPAPPTDQLGDNAAGTACTADGDCSGGRCLTMRGQTALPGGYCSGACLMDSHCGAGGVCRAALGGGAGSCYQACASDAECTRDGYRCRELGDMLMGCNPAPDPLPDNSAGNACTSDADCGGQIGSCATELPVAAGGSAPAMGGYCSIACAIDADCGAGGLCVNTRSGARCFKPCTALTDCRTGYACDERGGGDMPDLVCTPDVPDDGDAG